MSSGLKVELTLAAGAGLLTVAVLAPAGIDALIPFVLGVMLYLACRFGGRPTPATSHGSARFASDREIEAAGFLCGRGMVLGRRGSRLLRVPDWANHILVTGPTGTGKNVSIIGPTLLSDTGMSLVVLDIKGGENTKLFGAWRAARGRKVSRLDIWGSADGSGVPAVRLDPVSLLDPGSPTLTDDALGYAVAAIHREPSEHQRFFNDMAVIVLHFLILFVAVNAGPEERHWASVVALAKNPEAFGNAVKLALTDAYAPLAQLAGSVSYLFGGADGRRGQEFYSVMATLSTHLASFESEIVRDYFTETTVDLAGLRRGDTDLFICMDASRLESHAAIPRLWVTAILRYLIAHPHGAGVLVILDEVAQIGRGIPLLETAITLLRSFGVKLAFFVQALPQLAKIFPTDQGQTALANFDVVQVLSPNDMVSAGEISKRLGSATVFVETAQDGGSNGLSETVGQPANASTSRNWGSSYSPHERPLLRPEELLLLGNRTLIFARGRRAVVADLIRYYSDPAFGEPGRRPRYLLGLLALVAAIVGTVYLVRLSNRMTPPTPEPAKPPAWRAPAQ